MTDPNPTCPDCDGSGVLHYEARWDDRLAFVNPHEIEVLEEPCHCTAPEPARIPRAVIDAEFPPHERLSF